VVTDATGGVSTASSLDLRRRLVHHLRQRGFLHDPRVADAFLAIPRELFLPDVAARSGLSAVYHDEAIVIERDPVSGMPLSSSSQPAIMALMLQMLDIRPGQRVLEIGAGTGYNAALLDRLVGSEGMVATIDIEHGLALRSARALATLGARVRVVVADGPLGLPGAAPLDRIEVTASSNEVPRAWYEQLRCGGKLVVPLRLSAALESTHAVTAFEKVPGGFDSRAVTPGGFMPLRRPEAGEEPNDVPHLSLERDAVNELRIAVRYADGATGSRWTLRRSDHVIGVDRISSGR
jgi:protein-L-isoaspartate(D-aspartate) O-methyltransferase